MMEFNKENLSTIAGYVYMFASPFLAKFGFEIDQSGFTSLFVGIVGLAVLIYSSMNPNQFKVFGNEPTTCELEEPVTDEETVA